MDLNQFLEWQRAGKRRTVSIELGRPLDKKHIRVWAYDYDLLTGQSVKSVDEIDLEAEKAKEEAEKAKEEKAEYERLKKKFEGEIK